MRGKFARAPQPAIENRLRLLSKLVEAPFSALAHRPAGLTSLISSFFSQGTAACEAGSPVCCSQRLGIAAI